MLKQGKHKKKFIALPAVFMIAIVVAVFAISPNAKAVGMSTACEAVAANHMGMMICGISCISNLASGMSVAPLSHKEVQETADRVSGDFKKLVTESIKNIHEKILVK